MAFLEKCQLAFSEVFLPSKADTHSRCQDYVGIGHIATFPSLWYNSLRTEAQCTDACQMICSM